MNTLALRPFATRLALLLSNRRGHLVALLCMYVLLAVEYHRFVYGFFSLCMGFQFGANPVAVVGGVLMLMAVVGLLFVQRPPNDRLYTLGLVVALLLCLPQIVMYQFGCISIFGSLYSLLFLALLVTPVLQVPSFAWPKIPQSVQCWALPLLCVLAFIPFVVTYGLPRDYSVFSLSEHIYDVRQSVASAGNIFTAYLQGPLYRVLLPLLLLMGLVQFRRRWWMVLLAAVLVLLLFMINPEKSILFSLGIVLICACFQSFEAKGGMLLYALLGVALMTVLLNLVTGNLMAESIVVRRLYFIPVLVSDAYFNFFDHSPLFLSHSWLSPLFDYPYDVEPSFLIGDIMYGRTTINCNTGFIADGFMNFGHLGAALFVVLAAALLHFIDSSDYDARYFGLVFLLLQTMVNSAFFTTLLTHGGFLLLVAFLFLVPKGRRSLC